MSTGIAAGATISPANFRGMIFPYAAATAPTGFLLCDGAAVSRTTYADLFALISTTYGIGDGSTTFNVPNLKGRFALGYAATAGTKIFTFSSRATNTITVTGADNHAHNELQTGQAVFYTTSGTVITGLTNNTTYYVVRIAFNQLQLATSVANANGGTIITLTGDGTGTQTFTITYTARPLGQGGGEETHALTDGELPSHTHDFNHYAINGGSGVTAFTKGASNTGDPELNVIDAKGNDVVHNTMPIFTVINYLIKT